MKNKKNSTTKKTHGGILQDQKQPEMVREEVKSTEKEPDTGISGKPFSS